MATKQNNIFILHDKLEKDILKQNTNFQDLVSVQRTGLKHKKGYIKIDTLRKIMLKDGFFENDKYVVIEGKLIKNKKQLFCETIKTK
tara:strand:- start:5096 stop:5356 length:261 start_codon:yes stop_codon:yes gene_type:complete